MSTTSQRGEEQAPLEGLRVGDQENFLEGPPLELFRRMRGECPVHWTDGFTEYPDEDGFWSITTAEDVHEVSRDWQTFSSELGGFTGTKNAGLSLEMQQSMFIGMDPPKHDRLKSLFQRGFTPKRIAEHEDAHPGDHDRRARPPRGPRDVRSGDRCGPAGRLAGDRQLHGPLARGRRAVGEPDERDRGRRGSGCHAGGNRQRDDGALVPEVFERCSRLIAERRETPTDDLTSVLVHAELDGERLEDHEIVMGFLLLMAAGNDSTKATYCSGMRALMENPEQKQMVLDDPSLVPGAVEESLRMFPAFAHFARTATHDTELHGQAIREGEKVVMWYPSSNRDETRFEDPDRFDVTRNAEHQAFGAGGRHFCLGTALARLELQILIEETLARFPEIQIDGNPRHVESGFANQLKTLPVRLAP